jgi:hypothetical protein
MKYNIALVPVKKSGEFIALSQKMSFLNTIYQLGENSLPHLTLRQFYAEEIEIDLIWGKVIDSLNRHHIELKFNNFSLKTFDDVIFYISLLPNNIAELNFMQSQVSLIVGAINNISVYDPHLTLISTLNKLYENKVERVIEEYASISDRFILSLGICDKIGQLIHIIKEI